jgi:hypothetical protein
MLNAVKHPGGETQSVPTWAHHDETPQGSFALLHRN